eukprot:scaffold1031_cov234-Chaetoceros_neogracile.AAC.5
MIGLESRPWSMSKRTWMDSAVEFFVLFNRVRMRCSLMGKFVVFFLDLVGLDRFLALVLIPRFRVGGI